MSKKPIHAVASAPAVALASGGFSNVVSLRMFRCRICKCEGVNPLSCGICKNRNCMDEMLSTALGATVSADGTVAEVKKRGSLAQAIAEGDKILRRKSGIPKLDAVLGGGYVDRSSILMAGDPGAGKSTLLLQACIEFAGPVKRSKKEQEEAEKLAKAGAPEMAAEVHRALYISGEEAFEQVGARAGRLKNAMKKAEWIEFVSTRSVPEIMGAVLDVRPHLTIVDSIQEVGDESLSGQFGGVNQATNAIRSVVNCIKQVGFGTVVFVCHVRKDGEIAGARKAEHLVDMVCKLALNTLEEEDEDGEEIAEVDRDERVLEVAKNRYGSIMESSTFIMTESGLF